MNSPRRVSQSPQGAPPPTSPRALKPPQSAIPSTSLSSNVYNFKVIIVGSSTVGNSIVSQLINKKIPEEHRSTKFVEFGAFIVTLSDNSQIKLQIWDTCGEEEYRSLTANYYRGAHAALLVYDITRRDSFNALQTWLDDVYQYSLPNVFVLCIGNKSDLEESREVTLEEGKSFALERGLGFLETSARTAMNVEESFLEVAKKVYFASKTAGERQPKQPSGVIPGSGISPSSSSPNGTQKSGCCS